MLSRHVYTLLSASFMWGGYCYAAYGVERGSFAVLCTIWVLGAAMCYWWVYYQRFSLRQGIWLGAVIRASLFFATPER